MLRIGVIGYGARIAAAVEAMRETGKCCLAAIADIDPEGARSRAEAQGCRDVRYYTDAEEMLRTERLDGVCIGTRCSLHTRYALLAGSFGLPVFLEKPVSTTEEELAQLRSLLPMGDRFVVSFPLRFTPIVKTVKEIIDSGRLGTIEHVQAYNNVPYGRCYYHGWCRDEGETGGLFLQKSTHDFDYINYLLGENKPVRLCAMESKQIFKGDKPAGVRCDQCPEAENCPESIENIRSYNEYADPNGMCCFATDTGNHDSASVIVEYESGMHVVYSQNFFARKGAKKRGARLFGYKGTVEFDFNTGVVTVYHHNEEITETYTVKHTGHHFGGDRILTRNFVDLMAGTAASKATLAEGILSADMCLATKRSAQDHSFQDIHL